MPTLDSCINFQFEPGFIGASSGETPVRPTLGTFEDPDEDPIPNPGDLTYSLDFSKFYNSLYAGSVV